MCAGLTKQTRNYINKVLIYVVCHSEFRTLEVTGVLVALLPSIFSTTFKPCWLLPVFFAMINVLRVNENYNQGQVIVFS